MLHTLYNEGTPKYYQGTEDEAVLVIHGYTGRPGEMDYLARALHKEGFTVSVPRLPGHGTSRQDLMRCTRKDWYRRVLDSYYDLASSNTRIHVAGLSMGGLLALKLASELPCESLALAAPAVLIRNKKSLALTPLMRLVMKEKQVRDFEFQHDPLQDPENHYLESEYYQWIIPGALAELYLLQREVRACLGKVTAPVLVITSRKDRVVPPNAGAYLKKHLGSRQVKQLVYEHSSHVIVNDSERQRAAEDIIRWFKSPESVQEQQ